MSTQREKISALLNDNPGGLKTAQVAEIIGHDRATTASTLSKGAYYGWWTRDPRVGNGNHNVVWKALEPETTGA